MDLSILCSVDPLKQLIVLAYTKVKVNIIMRFVLTFSYNIMRQMVIPSPKKGNPIVTNNINYYKNRPS